VIVHDFDLVGIAIFPYKADAPLVVDANAVLPCPVVLQGLKPVARWEAQGVKARCGVQLRELTPGNGVQCRRQAANVFTGEDAGGVLVRERLDHGQILTLLVISGKRYGMEGLDLRCDTVRIYSIVTSCFL